MNRYQIMPTFSSLQLHLFDGLLQVLLCDTGVESWFCCDCNFDIPHHLWGVSHAEFNREIVSDLHLFVDFSIESHFCCFRRAVNVLIFPWAVPVGETNGITLFRSTWKERAHDVLNYHWKKEIRDSEWTILIPFFCWCLCWDGEWGDE